MSLLEQQFEQAMFDIYRRAKAEAKYNASIFLQMVTTRGGVDTARYLINQPKPSDGYTRLFECGRLDLTVEAMLVENEKWHALFAPEEIKAAKIRLAQYGYKKK